MEVRSERAFLPQKHCQHDMSNDSSFRTHRLFVTRTQFDALTALADVSNDDCADSCAERLLGAALGAQADLAWLIARRRADRQRLADDYRDRLRTAQGGQAT